MKAQHDSMTKRFLKLVAKEERGPQYHRYLRRIKGQM